LFDDAQHICRLCHTPLDKQQPHIITGYRDKNKWDPIIENNPDFDPKLQHEGVTCTACHYSNGKILGVYGNTNVPHPVEKLVSPNQICVRCHVVSGELWDTFFRFPPCGTVAEIKSSRGKTFISGSGEMSFEEIATLGCVDCHMPITQRPLVKGGKTRTVRRHLWRGGHDPQMVKQALDITLTENSDNKNSNDHLRHYIFTITNTGAFIEANVRYHLMDESRRNRNYIGSGSDGSPQIMQTHEVVAPSWGLKLITTNSL